MDTMGVEDQDEEGFNVQDVIYLINGNVKPNYKFNTRCPISETDTAHFKKDPTLADKAHCIVIVLSATVVDSDSISGATEKKVETLKEYIRSHEVPIVIVLTKIDRLDENVDKDITKAYNSRPVESIVKKANELFGVPKMNIFPMRNYSEELDMDENMDILVLLALRQILRIASDRLESQAQNLTEEAACLQIGNTDRNEK